MRRTARTFRARPTGRDAALITVLWDDGTIDLLPIVRRQQPPMGPERTEDKIYPDDLTLSVLAVVLNGAEPAPSICQAVLNEIIRPAGESLYWDIPASRVLDSIARARETGPTGPTTCRDRTEAAQRTYRRSGSVH